jgi:hypothetical protein
MGGSAIVAINNMRRADFDIGMFMVEFFSLIVLVVVVVIIDDFIERYKHR